MGWRKNWKGEGLRMRAVMSRDSSCFKESFYRSNMIKMEYHLFDNILLLISYYMDIYLKLFQIYKKDKRMPEAPPRVCTRGDKHSREEMQGTHPSM